jgi:hypothetical protein
MSLHILSICIRYLDYEKKNDKKIYHFFIEFKYVGAKRVTGYILDPKFIVVGQFYNINKGYIKISTENLGYFKLVIVDANNVQKNKKINFNIYLPENHKKNHKTNKDVKDTPYKIFNKKQSRKSLSKSLLKLSSKSSSKISSKLSSESPCKISSKLSSDSLHKISSKSSCSLSSKSFQKSLSKSSSKSSKRTLSKQSSNVH